MIYLYLFMAPYVLECCVDSEVETARGRDGHVVDTHRTGTIGCRSRDLRIGARVAGQQEEVAAGNRGSEPLDVGVAFLEEPGEVVSYGYVAQTQVRTILYIHRVRFVGSFRTFTR